MHLPDKAFKQLMISPGDPVSVALDCRIAQLQQPLLTGFQAHSLCLEPLKPNYLEFGMAFRVRAAKDGLDLGELDPEQPHACNTKLTKLAIAHALRRHRLLRVGDFLEFGQNDKVQEFRVRAINGEEETPSYFLLCKPEKVQLELIIEDFAASFFTLPDKAAAAHLDVNTR